MHFGEYYAILEKIYLKWGYDMLSLYLAIAETESERELIEKLYREKRQRMFAAAKRYLKTDEDAEDAVHEAFLRIASGKTKIFEIVPNKINRYLDIIIRNICVDVIKEHVEKEEYLKDTVNMPIVSLEDTVLSDISKDELLKCVQRLPTSQRDAIYLKIVLEISDKEGARMLNISENAFRQRVFEARKAIRSDIEKRNR